VNNVLEQKIKESYKVLDLFMMEKNISIAFSGGKDSTLLCILVYNWLRDRNIKGKNIIIIHNDTLSELDLLENYARSFMSKICELIKETGNECEVLITRPEHNFYWRVIVAGYPAPNFMFRWCVNHLKVIPNKTALNLISKKNGRIVLLTGHREDESSARAKIIKRDSVCPLGEMSCNSSFFLKVDIQNTVKVMPIKNWTLDDVWNYLELVKEVYGLDMLFEIYGGNKVARYGCWHCTLVKIQKNIYNLAQDYLYLEGGRILYRIISDMPEMRMTKNWGRTTLGPLNELGRAVMLKAFPIIEKLSGKRLYGLDEEYIGDYSLREIFYQLNAEKANELIKISAKNLKNKDSRVIEINKIREAKIGSKLKDNIMKLAHNYEAYRILAIRSEDYFNKILDLIE
jgi:DNA sulfur modification protein DndC